MKEVIIKAELLEAEKNKVNFKPWGQFNYIKQLEKVDRDKAYSETMELFSDYPQFRPNWSFVVQFNRTHRDNYLNVTSVILKEIRNLVSVKQALEIWLKNTIIECIFVQNPADVEAVLNSTNLFNKGEVKIISNICFL